MGTLLHFGSEEALQLALTSALVPEAVQAGAARVRCDESGALVVEPAEQLGRRPRAALVAAGVAAKRGSLTGAGVRKVACWGEIISPRWRGEERGLGGVALFGCGAEEGALELAGELLRLGCDRQELCLSAVGRRHRALLRAVDPPYYTIAGALDRADRRSGVYLPSPPGQERVWIELGYEHPLAGSLCPPDDGLLLIGGDGGWRRCASGPWIDLYQLLDVELPQTVERRAEALPGRLRVSLRLARRARDATPSLWVLGRDGPRIVDSLVRQLPQREIGRLLFAVARREGDEPLVVLRARTGRSPQLELPGEALAPLLGIEQLFAPCDAIVEPPLRRETLTRLLAPDAERVSWLASGEGPHGFRVEQLADSAFNPLDEWIDYVIDDAAAELEPWVRAATIFEIEAFESIGAEWSERPPAASARPEPRRRRREPREAPARAPASAAGEEPAADDPVAELDVEQLLPAAPARRSVEEEQLLALQREFVALEVAADDPRRTALWRELARAETRLGQPREAGLCWTRALWESEAAQLPPRRREWARAEALLLLPDAPEIPPRQLVETLLQERDPSRQQVRTAASQLLASAAEGWPPQLQQRLVNWLDEHDHRLDVRSLWLVRLALSRLAGGDRLQLVRARDRILGRLRHGLSVERDVPTFMRFLGCGEGTVTELVGELDRLLRAFHGAKRRRSPVEAPEALTGAYVQLTFAWGFARLGEGDRARALVEEARGALTTADAIHAFLARAYGARVEQALAGEPAQAALPREVAGLLNALDRLARYKVDRLRQSSQILEPQERLDPTLAFVLGGADPRGDEFAPMRGMVDSEQLAAAVGRVMEQALAADADVEERTRLFDGVMDFFPMLPEAGAVPHLQRLVASVADVEPVRRCQLLEEALMLAGFFGRDELVVELVARLKQLFGELGADHAAEVGSTVAECLRGLRRVGLPQQAAELLQRADGLLQGESCEVVVARLQLAAGLLDLGRVEQAQPVLRLAHRALAGEGLLPVERAQLTRALALALSYAPQEQAFAGLRRLAEQLPAVSDAFNTNSHFCLSVIQLMESLVLGVASEQLALGEQGRRWLDEDEYLVRRRIHRDLAADEDRR